EWRAGSEDDLRHRTNGSIVVFLDDALTVLEDKRLVLHTIVRRQPPFGFAQRHRTTAGMKTYAEFACGLDLTVHVIAVFEHVTMVENSGAAGQGQFGQANQRAGTRGFRGRASPHT